MGEVMVSVEEGMEVELVTEEEKKKKKTEIEGGGGVRDVVSWEKILPRMVLKVLLVEADDSTRQIIAALLRKCSYRVAAVSDGLKAWETLNKKHHDIDLILTEVELPSISGFALLSLVMEHEDCKNIPVIMMSSHDSISTVFRCMLKGAADFLIKPVRRNELRNLWQHVWRRHALGGNLPQGLNFPLQKVGTDSENTAASNHSSGCVASSQKNNDCSVKESDNQGHSQLKCRSASNLSNSYSSKSGASARSEKELRTHDSGDEEKSSKSISETQNCNQACSLKALRIVEDWGSAKTVNEDELTRPECSRGTPNVTNEIHDCENESVRYSGGAIDLIGTFDNLPKTTGRNFNLNGAGTKKFDFSPQLELSLRRNCSGSPNHQATDTIQTWSHSDASAFSWYTGGKPLQSLFPTTSTGSSKVNDSVQSHNDNNMTSLVVSHSEQAELQFPSHVQLGLIPDTGASSNDKHIGYGDVSTTMFYPVSGFPPPWSPQSTCKKENSSLPAITLLQSNTKNQNSEQAYRWYDDATCISNEQTVHEQNNAGQLEEASCSSPASNSLCNDAASHVKTGAHESLGIRSKADAASVVENVHESNVYINGGLRGVDSHRSSQREAALTKFRMKRKDRCFEKKVRYQSRKRLAEQRPRVKGQFVRQVHTDPLLADADGGD